ncbi:TPA: O-antigen polymerase [Citrobacter freundii]
MNKASISKNDKRFLISPLFAVIISTVVFFIAWCFPKDTYVSLISEKNYINFDQLSLLFYIVNILFFLFGYSILKDRVRERAVIYNSVLSVSLYLVFPILVSIVLSVISITLLIKQNPFILQYLIAGDGFNIKRELDLKNTIAQAAQFSISIVLWALFVFNNLKDQMSASGRITIKLLIYILFLVCFLNAVFKMARFEIIPLILGYMVIFINHKYKSKSNYQLLKYLFAFFIVVVTLFAIFSILRGGSSAEAILGSVLGYTITSYNHMAALLNGALHYFDPGIGYYIATFLSYIPLAGDGFTTNVLGWASPEYVRLQEFNDSSQGGLNDKFIWLTTFGYVWVSLKYLTPLFMFFYGFFAKIAWVSFKNNLIWGVFLYPWIFFSIIFWLGSNIVIQQPLISVIGAFVFIKMYDFVFKWCPVK